MIIATHRLHEELELDENDSKYVFWYKHGLAMLNISDVDIDDSGQYVCIASNRLGTCTTVGELNVQGSHPFSAYSYSTFSLYTLGCFRSIPGKMELLAKVPAAFQR